jgi:hypothetical protein
MCNKKIHLVLLSGKLKVIMNEMSRSLPASIMGYGTDQILPVKEGIIRFLGQKAVVLKLFRA